MATTATISKVKSAINSAWTVSWTLANSQSGDNFANPGSSDRSVHVSGTFGVGGSVTVEGSNDGTNYYALTDPQGNALTFTTARLEGIQELTQYVRPRVTAGDGTTALTIVMMAAGNYRG